MNTRAPAHNDYDTKASSSWIARRTEALFSDYPPTNLSIFVFCGSVCLGLISIVIGNHSITYNLANNDAKQVGFLWAPNWTIVFLFLLPIYVALIGNLLQFWKTNGRRQLYPRISEAELSRLWARRNQSATLSYWAIFFVCVPVTAAFNWYGTHFVPVSTGDMQGLSVDWGRIAILRPEVVTVSESIVFSGLVFLYMSACSFLFFVGLLICVLIATDLYELSRTESSFASSSVVNVPEIVVKRLQAGLYRCVVLGLLITVTIKAQSVYLLSPDSSIIQWFIRDALFFFDDARVVGVLYDYSVPALFNSFISAMAIVAVYAYSSTTLKRGLALLETSRVSQESKLHRSATPWLSMSCVVGLLAFIYFSIGMFSGFALISLAVIAFATYTLYRPLGPQPLRPLAD